MPSSVSTGYDSSRDAKSSRRFYQKGDLSIKGQRGWDAANITTAYEKGNFSIKLECAYSATTAVTISSNINNKYSFNISLGNFSISASIKDTTNLGASFTVAYGCPSPLEKYFPEKIAKLRGKLKEFSSKHSLSYKYYQTINHRGESLSLRTTKGLGDDIPLTQYGTQPITLAGGERIDITASTAQSLEAKSSLNTIQGVMATMAAAQVAALGFSIAKFGATGSKGFRGNATVGAGAAALLSGGAGILALVPMVAMFMAGKKSPPYAGRLKGPDGCATPNSSGILMDASSTPGGNIAVKGQEILFQNVNSSLMFDKNGSIDMSSVVNCSLETSGSSGQAGVWVSPSSVKATAGKNTYLAINSTTIDVKHAAHSIKLSPGGVNLDGVMITPAGASMPCSTVVNGLVNSA